MYSNTTIMTSHSRRWWRGIAAFSVVIAALTFAHAAAATGGGGGGDTHWVGTWTTSPQSLANTTAPDVVDFDDQTIRQIMRVSIGGSVLRVRFSNEQGDEPLIIGAASIALSDGGAAIVPGTSVPLTFGGETSVSVPPGAPMLSDPVMLNLPALGDAAISLYLPEPTTAGTFHRRAIQTTYISPPGDYTESIDMPQQATAVNWYFLGNIDVLADEDAAAVVTLGDSITDGTVSTVDANARWPNFLAARLQSDYRLDHLAVLNQGISGNRVLHDRTGDNVLARFDRDVVRQPGVKFVVVLIGINDIGFSVFFPDDEVSVEEIINGHRQLIARAHQRGLTIYGATLTPFQGAGYYSDEGEVKRQAFNDWMRTSGEYDGVIDFDLATRDPDNPLMFLPEYNSGDNLHPNDTGYEAMGNFVDLGLFASEDRGGHHGKGRSHGKHRHRHSRGW